MSVLGYLFLFVPCIEMDADVDYGRKKGIMFSPVNSDSLERVIVEDSVVDSFCYGTLFIDIFISISSHWKLP